ncbi:ABC transporter ATP-binding protein [Streptomyces sp. NPDC059853]|uniref:ABC transporter ATP-binding protein n=1 Tax=Streptomyces sp. NPDC059853 TaxID=3346973 RepID=UPI0036569507
MAEEIVARDLHKSFIVRDKMFGPRKQKTAVNRLTLSIPRGRVTGLLGLNGAGKTTTIKMISTLLRPTSGTVTVDGLDSVANARAVRGRLNLIAGGERMVYARMTGRENLHYFGRLYGVSTQLLRPRADELLDTVGLAEAADTLVERYSRGMTQRLAIARGLINDPAYLLLDEPTLGLDAPIARDLRRVIAKLVTEGKGILLTSHYLTEVEELCQHVYVIARGSHLVEGSPAVLTASAGLRRTVEVVVPRPDETIVGAASEFGERVGAPVTYLQRDDGSLVVSLSHTDDIAGPLVTAIVAAGGAVAGLTINNPSLEGAILALADATEPSPVRGGKTE